MEKDNLGLGVMINMLFGNEGTAKNYKAMIGKKISGIKLEDNALIMFLYSGLTFKIYDDGQSCCENRYMRTDDDLEEYVGAELLQIEVADGGTTEGDGETHEIQFLRIHTSKGLFTLSNHNEHNGYYGGFSIKIEEIK